MSQERESKSSGVGYVGVRLSRKQLKVWLASVKTPEERAIIVSMMPEPPRHKKAS